MNFNRCLSSPTVSYEIFSLPSESVKFISILLGLHVLAKYYIKYCFTRQLSARQWSNFVWTNTKTRLSARTFCHAFKYCVTVTSQVLLPLASRKLIVAVTQIWFCVFYSNVNSYVFCKQFWDIFLVFWYSVISSSYFLFLCVSILFQELSFAVSETFTHISTYTLRFCVFENTDAFTLFGWKVLVFFIIWSSVNSKKEYLTRKLNKDQAPVVQRMDDAICQLNHQPADKRLQNKLLYLWIVINFIRYPLNNQGHRSMPQIHKQP